MRVAPQFKRVAVGVVDTPQHHIDTLQPFQRFHPELAVAHGQVIALHKAVAQVGGEVGLLEIGLVQRSWGQNHDAWIIGEMGSLRREGVAEGPKEA